MGLFKKKKIEQEDTRTELEKTFEEKGRSAGAKTGMFVQKSVDKINEVKEKLERDGKLDKLRELGHKVDDKIDGVVDKVSKKGKQVVNKVKKNPKKDIIVEEGSDYYE